MSAPDTPASPVASHDGLRMAYVDPPYLGCCALYGHEHNDRGARHFDGGCWDDPETHARLIKWLTVIYPDGWAMSASVPSLRTLLPMCPEDVRIASWVKSFSAFKKGVRPAYAWEPVIFRGGRNPGSGHPHAPPEKGGKQNTPKDFHLTETDGMEPWEVIVCPITLRKGLTGAKPAAFCDWVIDLLNARPDLGDRVADVFTGTGIFGERWSARAIDTEGEHVA